jgi:hypothetical protein
LRVRVWCFHPLIEVFRKPLQVSDISGHKARGRTLAHSISVLIIELLIRAFGARNKPTSVAQHHLLVKQQLFVTVKRKEEEE